MKLFILGNGFDISHNIPCRYSNFYNYLLEDREDILEVMEKFYCVDNESDLWSDFETSLEKDFIYDSLSDIIAENTPNLGSDDFRDSQWNDAEIYVEQECEDLLKNIREGFEEWITSLNTLDLIKAYKLNRSDFYITFNYTETLENLYRIPTNRILHIHNKVGEKLIFGHGKNSNDFNVKKELYGNEKAFIDIDELGNVESREVGHEKFAENAVCRFYDMMRKPTEEVIEKKLMSFNDIQNIEEIIVLGHSYNNIDLPYFKKIQELVGEVKWTLYYFSENDILAAKGLSQNLNFKEGLVNYKHCRELEVEDIQLKLF